MPVIAAAEPKLPLRAVRAVGREHRFLVLAQQEALLAPQPHGANIRRRTGRIYWPTGLLQMDQLDKRRARGHAVSPHPEPAQRRS